VTYLELTTNLRHIAIELLMSIETN